MCAVVAAGGELTTGQLIDQIKKLAIALDPDWARRRYEQALADHKVIGHRNPDGTANLSGIGLPVDRVAAASARIDTLAKAAKHAGSPRLIDHLRAELFLGMTDGTYTGMDDTTILALLLATGDDSGDDTDVSADGADSDFSEPTDTKLADTEPADSHTGDSETGVPGTGTKPDSAAGCGDPAAEGAENDPAATVGVSGRARGGIELRVRVSTLLGRDQYPAEIAGWGPVHAELARDLIPTLLRGQWRYAIIDARGQLLHAGITRARPTGRSGAAVGRTRDVVELQVPAALLDELAQDTTGLGAWAAVLTDLARQHADHEEAMKAGAQRFADDADRRHPGAVLRRHLQIRDRTCVGPGCRAPAARTDQDHTVDHAHGGLILMGNLGGPWLLECHM